MSLHKKIARLIGLLAWAAAVSIGSGNTAAARQLENVVDTPTAAAPGVQINAISQAIVRGGARRGWVIRPVAVGRLRGTLRVRSHVAVVDITHDTKTFSITYVRSVNLRYRKEDGVEYIHGNYNSWVRYLEQEIRLAIGLLP